jgi:nucleotide-binding universal stress UspA family protein
VVTRPAGTPATARTRLLVGYDGTPEGEDALALARVLGAPLGAETVAACVTALPHRPGARQQLPRLEWEAEETLAAATGDDLERRPVVSSSAARGLFELADEEQVDMLVVGSSHHSGLGAVLAGSVGRALLQGAPCPVAIAPRDYRSQDLDRLRVLQIGYDGSPEAERALDGAIELALAAEATMRLVAVLTPVQTANDSSARHDALREAVGAARDRCPAELRADARARTGDAATILRDEAEMGVDLLVVGSRGYGPALRTMLGSVAAELIAWAPCPVLVYPRAASRAAR